MLNKHLNHNRIEHIYCVEFPRIINRILLQNIFNFNELLTNKKDLFYPDIGFQ